ncbi:lipoprotein [Thermosulfurimonas sp. F29]|uniref:LptM family lipoprotein n=1 Tax=Thermosulfurimonas sp. F29 TaxID=2867247 RepID=UPI001C83C1F5|nr:hypothetical protein [Thermosulfurimonas sp. F29]MBX6422565.1 hypothetical protein [Thermosulfurimonas sp. F29]
MKRWVGLLILIILVSCGRKGPPLPPEAVRPEVPRDFRLTLHPLFAELSVRVPVEDIRGEALRRIKAFEIERVMRRPGGEGPELRKVLRVPFGGSPARSPRFYWRDRDLHPGWCYRYRVRAVKGWRSVSPWTPARKFCWSTPPRTPEGFEVHRILPHTVFLSWWPSRTDLHGLPLPGPVLYRIRRRSAGEEITFPPLRATSFFDSSARAGTRYCYSVEPLLSYYGTLVPGFRTPEICIIP